MWGFFWLLLFPTIGIILSAKFNYPELLGNHPWLTFGRLRPIHVNGVIWGSFSTLFIGLSLYIVPRLCGVRLWKEEWGYALLWAWNLNLAAAAVLLALGWNRGWEADEFPLFNVVVIFLAFLLPRPRDFTSGVFKFRVTPSGSLPTDGDLFRTLTRGVRWTAMPTWHELPEKDRLAVIQHIKTFSRRWREEKPEPPVAIPDPPTAGEELLRRGRELYVKAKCWECHGEEGRGDGPTAPQLRDDSGVPISPTDFTKGQFKGGSSVADIYRGVTTGLDGTPMPSFADTFGEDERWALSYFVLSLSAWRDPLTGKRLPLSEEAKAALNSSEVRASHPRLAYDPNRLGAAMAKADSKRRVYYPGIAE